MAVKYLRRRYEPIRGKPSPTPAIPKAGNVALVEGPRDVLPCVPNTIQSVKTYPWADVNSDHNLLLGKLKVRLRRIKQPTMKNKLNLEILTDGKVLNEKPEASIEKTWQSIKKSITEVKKNNLGQIIKTKKRPRTTDNIFNLMNGRRRHKNVNDQQYKQIHRQIKREIRTAKEKHFANEYNEIENYMRVGDSFNLHKKIKDATIIVLKSAESTFTDVYGNLITNLENKFEIWQQYSEKELFHDIRPEEHKITSMNQKTKKQKDLMNYQQNYLRLSPIPLASHV
ncbi:hypothetical protein QTP88_024166 [Uroleucon formosanum]